MRARFAVLIAAAIVFVPGWYGVGAMRDPRGSDFSARTLAPTSDDEAVREAAANMNAQLGGRQAKRLRPGITFEAVAALGLGALVLGLFGGVSSHSRPVFGAHRLGFHLSRAPPRLQPA